MTEAETRAFDEITEHGILRRIEYVRRQNARLGSHHRRPRPH